MKITGIEKGILAAIGISIIILCFTIPSCIKSCHQIEKEGFKSSVDKLWNGDKSK
jgi:hypothetical protein